MSRFCVSQIRLTFIIEILFTMMYIYFHERFAEETHSDLS
jgi:hypothetical protein